jgi:hypothetical protein
MHVNFYYTTSMKPLKLTIVKNMSEFPNISDSKKFLKHLYEGTELYYNSLLTTVLLFRPDVFCNGYL